MVIGDRLRELREEKKFTQGDIEKRTGLLRAYISRVENGHTVPAVETLEKFARALEVPMYQLSTMAKNLPSCRIFRSAGLPTTSCGAARARTHACLPSSVGCSVAWKPVTWEWCCSWHRRWRGGRQFEDSTLPYIAKTCRNRCVSRQGPKLGTGQGIDASLPQSVHLLVFRT